MKKIITKDNSITFFNEQYQETYHATSGAKQEAQKKFVEPTKEKVNPKILDICFGLGYNTAAALEQFQDCHITALENDTNILERVQEIQADFTEYEEIKKATKKLSKKINIILGDATKTIKSLPDNHFDIVFLDPFSPKKCPELWSEEFIQDIYNKTAKNGMLTTYSCAKIVRENLTKAGFTIQNGLIVGRRGPATVAKKLI